MEVRKGFHLIKVGSLRMKTLSKYVNEHQNDWDLYLDHALFALRSKPHTTTKVSPFQLMYGREARFPSEVADNLLEFVLPTESEYAGIIAEKKIRKAEVQTKQNIEVAQEIRNKNLKREFQRNISCAPSEKERSMTNHESPASLPSPASLLSKSMKKVLDVWKKPVKGRLEAIVLSFKWAFLKALKRPDYELWQLVVESNQKQQDSYNCGVF
ncbi:uncharacterized protein LOC144822784 [Lissotriton helveticus]